MIVRRLKRRRRGAAAVEFALTVPIVFIFFFASVEFGRMNMIWHSTHNAAYEAARRGLVNGTSDEEVRQRALAVLGAATVRNANVEVNQTETQVNVRVTVPFADNAWVPPAYFQDMVLASNLTLNKDAAISAGSPNFTDTSAPGDDDDDDD